MPGGSQRALGPETLREGALLLAVTEVTVIAIVEGALTGADLSLAFPPLCPSQSGGPTLSHLSWEPALPLCCRWPSPALQSHQTSVLAPVPSVAQLGGLWEPGWQDSRGGGVSSCTSQTSAPAGAGDPLTTPTALPRRTQRGWCCGRTRQQPPRSAQSSFWHHMDDSRISRQGAGRQSSGEDLRCVPGGTWLAVRFGALRLCPRQVLPPTDQAGQGQREPPPAFPLQPWVSRREADERGWLPPGGHPPGSPAPEQVGTLLREPPRAPGSCCCLWACLQN